MGGKHQLNKSSPVGGQRGWEKNSHRGYPKKEKQGAGHLKGMYGSLEGCQARAEKPPGGGGGVGLIQVERGLKGTRKVS